MMVLFGKCDSKFQNLDALFLLPYGRKKTIDNL